MNMEFKINYISNTEVSIKHCFIPHQTLYTADEGLGPNICRKIK